MTVAADKALKNEAKDENVVNFKFDGEDYTFDKRDMNDVDILELFEIDKVVTPIKMLLGDKQWAQFKSKKRTAEELGALAEAMFAEVGTTPGE